MPARKILATCDPGCRFKCETKVSEIARTAFFDEYWNVVEHSRKYDVILRHVTETCNDENSSENSRKKCSRQFSINDRGKNIVVCRTMFLNILNISKQIVDTAFKKFKSGESYLIDKRGHSQTRPRAVAEETTANVMDHINYENRTTLYAKGLQQRIFGRQFNPK